MTKRTNADRERLLALHELSSVDVGVGSIRVDLVRALASLDGEELLLQPLQLRMLAFFLKNVGQVISRQVLRDTLFRVAQAPDSTGVARQVCLLRRNLGELGHCLSTVPGGYCMLLPPSPVSPVAGDDGTGPAHRS